MKKHARQRQFWQKTRWLWLALFVWSWLGAQGCKKMSPMRAAKSVSQGAMAPASPVMKVPAAKKKAKNGKQGKDDKKAQVWQRTEKGTVLSKVSVGDKKYLELKKLRVTVQVEGIRVRTIMDHIYYNPHKRTLEGTFKYTLPPDASVSYYAMFVGQQRQRAPRFFAGKGMTPRRLLRMRPQEIAAHSPKKDWGKLREARLVPAEKGREVYEEITRRRIDPALLQQDAPNTFSGRVFPIRAKGYNRIIIAYEQTLPRFQGERVYQFRFPPDVAGLIDYTLEYNPKLSTLSRHNLRKIRCRTRPKQTFLRCMWESAKPDRNAVFYFKPKVEKAAWVAGIDPTQNRRYVFGQLRVDLPKKAAGAGANQAIFMLDTSLSENPSRFGASVALLEKILAKNKGIKQFNVLFYDVGFLWASPKGWIPNTPEQRKALSTKLNTILLEGATDLSAAMNALAAPAWLKTKQKDAADVFFLSDGQLNWGNRDLNSILGAYARKSRWEQTRFFAYRLGLGSENVSLYRRLVRKGGAVFSCLGQAELDRCATAHTHQSMTLDKIKVEGIGAKEVLVAGRQASLYPGALLTFAAQYAEDKTATVTLFGRFEGKPIKHTYKLPIKAQGDIAPRAWAELAINQLDELDDPNLTRLIVSYAQHFRIPNKHCSFLVLETDKEYKEYGLEKEQKEQKVDDVALFITLQLKQKGAPKTPRDHWRLLLQKGMKKAKMKGKQAAGAVLTLLTHTPETDFAMRSTTRQKLWTKAEVPESYRKTRTKSRDDFGPFVTEAKRRLKKEAVSGAIRSLSCIVELHPANPKALRLVGYYLSSWKRSEEAARIFLRVLERRSFEPHSYRDLARTMQKLKRYTLAAALYEILLAGQWHVRFGSIATIVREEYAMLIQEAMASKALASSARGTLRQRKALLGLSVPRSKLRVTITWNTDNTDIDLWVVEPSGEKCYYKNKKTRNGGALLQDITRGYGPERYENKNGRGGTYNVKLHFYGNNSNVLGNETHASVIIIQNAGTPQQHTIEKNLVLKKRGRIVNVANIKFPGGSRW